MFAWNSPRRLERWTASRKRDVIIAVEGGDLSEAEAQALFRISPEELESWRMAYAEAGTPGLKVAKLARPFA